MNSEVFEERDELIPKFGKPSSIIKPGQAKDLWNNINGEVMKGLTLKYMISVVLEEHDEIIPKLGKPSSIIKPGQAKDLGNDINGEVMKGRCFDGRPRFILLVAVRYDYTF